MAPLRARNSTNRRQKRSTFNSAASISGKFVLRE